jgi:hypothetical protein
MSHFLELVNSPRFALVSGAGLVAAYLLLSFASLFWHDGAKSKPTSPWAIITKPAHMLKARFNAWRFLFHGPAMIQEAYEKVSS